jgi:PTH1 family peptidyl-tRNA hydrolase
MFLIIGLGNPGEKYEKTWHNAGFLTVDEFKRNNNFPDFRMSKKLRAELSEGSSGKEKITLAKPQTFMNNSGEAVKSLISGLKLKPANLIVVHDDIDLPIGKMTVAKNRGSAGHNGVESIIKILKSKDFIRIRIGIQPKIGKPKNPEKYVLQKLGKEENVLKEVFSRSVSAVGMILEKGLEKAMNEYNK